MGFYMFLQPARSFAEQNVSAHPDTHTNNITQYIYIHSILIQV